MADADSLDLDRFFPYRLAMLADAVSHMVAQLYADRFDLSRAGWRILAALGGHGSMTAKQAGDMSALEKMQVSRAVAELEEKGLVTRHPDPDDRRNRVLGLTARGLALYRRIVPLALAREEYVLSALSPDERDQLADMMDRLLRRARELGEVG